jgi:hypothetical protein
MPLIGALAVTVVAAASMSLAAIVIIVILGIRHEERVLSMTRRVAPGLTARLARLVIGLYVRKTDPEPVRGDDLDPAPPPARECGAGMAGR